MDISSKEGTDYNMNIALDATNGICWSVVYVTAITLGFRHRTWYLPKVAICQNFVWELLVVINRLQNGFFGFAFFVQLVWLLLDVGVLITWIKYDKATNFPQNIVILLLVFAILYTLAYNAGKWEFAAFLINLIMSMGFVLREHRNGNCPDSAIIAVMKLLGTLAATILCGLLNRSPLILWLGGLCFLADSYYVGILFIKRRGKKYEMS